MDPAHRMLMERHRQQNQSSSVPTWLVVIVLIIGVLDICIVARIFTHEDGRQATCSLQSEPTNCLDASEKRNSWSQTPQADGCLRAAVFEHNRVDPGNDLAQQIQQNLAIYDRVARLASSNQANMIVFPEDGLLMGARHLVEPHLQEIPDPIELSGLQNNNNPCLRPDLFGTSEILRNLSCIARENKLYVIANFGTRQNCEPGEQVQQRKCPPKGFFALNTNVVLDPAGNFIRRYRKYNLFVEIFDHPPSLEEVHFDTPFGRFGLFTCFDILFQRPAMNLVERHQVDTVLFPTWWYDEVPILSATLSQDAWSMGNAVNLLAANVFRRHLGSVGSGIYSANQTLHTTSNSSQAHLLIATIASEPRGGSGSRCTRSFDPVSIEVDTGQPVQPYRNSNFLLKPSDKFFTLQQLEARKTICSKQVCCTIDYKINASHLDGASQEQLSRFVLIARDDNRLGTFNWYEQICLLATLEKPLNLGQLNETVYSREPLTSFEKLSIGGTFESRHVFPFGGHQMTEPVERRNRHFECHEMGKLIKCEHALLTNEDESLKEKKIYSFGLYGRMYDRDIMPEGWN